MKYTEFKERKNFAKNKVVPLLAECGFQERAEKIALCGHFKNVAICKDCGTWHFNGASSCKDRFCPLCQKKRSLLWFSKITPLLHDYLDKGYFVNILNFTIRDVDNLKYGVDLLNDAFRYLTHDNHQLAREFNKRFIGGLRSMEIVTGANSGKWHPHLHCMVVKFKYSKDFEWLKGAWEHSLQVVAHTAEKIGSVYIKGFTADNRKGIETAICETFKYMTKFNWKAKDIPELVNTMEGRRTISTWGCIRYMLSDYDAENEMDMTLTEIKDRICSTCGGQSFDLIDNIAGDHMRLADFYDIGAEYEKIKDKINDE